LTVDAKGRITLAGSGSAVQVDVYDGALLADDASAGAAQAVVVSAVDRLGNESERVSVLR
ncbi:MAG: hypothetical protein J0626_01235, partial [Rhodospirillaceae bacterium]|nr:hypothetical protein [Rhodospirillaceae bacterium]